jgi:hypothetical protein
MRCDILYRLNHLLGNYIQFHDKEVTISTTQTVQDLQTKVYKPRIRNYDF